MPNQPSTSLTRARITILACSHKPTHDLLHDHKHNIHSRAQIAAKIQCTMAYTEYTTGQGGAQLVSRRVSTRAAGGSLLDVRVDNGSDLVAVVTHGEHDRNHGTRGEGGEDHPDYDTFDNVLQATSHHDSMYAYFYMDDNHKVSAGSNLEPFNNPTG